MALLVFLTFLSLIVNQYVPVWMKDSEAAHMNSALGQMGGVKGAIDLQMLAAQSARYAGTFYIPVTGSSAVSLGVDGVPIFSASTIGTLSSNPDAGIFTVSFNYMINGQSIPVREQSSGSIDLDVQNRYFIPQRIAYENGAVIRYQSDGEVIRAQPSFAVITKNNSLDVSFGLVSLYGNGIVTGTSTEIVNTQVFAFDRQDYSNFASNAAVWINHTSRYGLAWYGYLNQTLATALNLPGTYKSLPDYVSFTVKIGATNIYTISSSFDRTKQLYTMALAIYNSLLHPISFFRLQHAQVQVGVGQESANVQF